MSQRGLYDPEIDSTPLPQFVEAREAEQKAHRAFKYGMVCGAITLAAGLLIGFAANGETIQIGGIYINGEAASSTTTVTIEPSGNPGELAIVTFVNEYVNDGGDTGIYPLAMGDVLTVEARFTWEHNPLTGADRIDLIVPAGITCEPESCGITVGEGQNGTVILYDWRGM
jgi:hypothetical protein